MVWRRQPLSVLLLLALLFSTVQAGLYEPSQAQQNESPQTDETIITDANTKSDKGINLEGNWDEDFVPEYPSSFVNNPRPTWEPTPSLTASPAFDHHGISAAQGLAMPNYLGNDVRVSILDYGLDIGHPDLTGSQFIQPSGTYQGWPVAFDPQSMGIWLREKKYEGTWYANTTIKGQPPFEVTHTILVDGRTDFAESEKLVVDPEGSGTSAADGAKKDFDLTELYVTHDKDFWFFGWPVTMFLNSNITYGLLIDVDNETSGTTTVPEGKLVSTNTTHTGFPPDDIAVNDVAVSPDSTMIATISSDKHVKVWRTDGSRMYDLTGHTSRPYSVAWSPDNSLLASRSKDRVIIWDIAGGGKRLRDFALPVPMDIDLGTDSRYSSSICFSPNGAWLAASADQRIHIFNVLTGSWVGNLTGATGGRIKSIAFNPTDPPTPEIVAGVDTYVTDINTVRIFILNPSNLQNVPVPPLATTFWSSVSPGHGGEILSVSWSPDGQRIVSTGKDNNVKLWAPSIDNMPRMSSNLHGNWVYASAWERSLTSPKFATVSKSSGQPPKSPLRIWNYDGSSAGFFELNRSTYAVDWTSSGDLATASLDLSARIWSGTSGTLQKVLVANKPDFAVMIDAGLNYSLKDLKWQKVVHNGTFYSWNGVDWGQGTEVTKPPINGTQAFFGIDELFVELGVPTSILGNPSGIAVEMFSVAQNNSHAQDTVPMDGNVFDINGDGKTDRESTSPPRPALDWNNFVTALGGFQYVPVRYYNVNTQEIPSASNTYHFGYHPSPQLATVYGSLGLLVVDPNDASNYTTVYIDMDNNKLFDASDVKVDKNNPIATYNRVGDATPDISAGMIYFIADGENYIPYSDRFRAINGIEENNKPENGELVAFAGEFRLDPDTNEPTRHGTQVASIIASRGNLNSLEMKGVAPGVKLIPIMNSQEDVLSSWYFAVEGYDGTPGNGDEAQIVLNPFEYPRTKDDGFDVFSRTADYLSTSYSGGKTVFFGPAGEEGFGYGSVASPAASPGIITVGRTADYSLFSPIYGGFSEGQNVHYSTIASTSSRGPTVPGFPKPDLVAIGNTAVDEPIIFGTDGSTAYSKFGITGSEVSAAMAAGVAALLMEAANRSGQTLLVEGIRNYLMSGAEDLGYDILVQGAGFMNASRSMKLLIGNLPGAGVHVSPPNWVPGTYKGQKPAAFTKLLFPGEGDQMSFTLENRDSASSSLTISGEVLMKTNGYSFSNKTVRTFNNDMFLWVNRSGVFATNDTNPFGQPIRLAPPLIQSFWDNAELLKLTAYGRFSDLIVPSGTDAFVNLHCYDMVLRDWQYDPFGLGFPSSSFTWEMNRLDEFGQTANVLEGRVSRPGQEIHDALVFELVGHLNLDSCRKADLEWFFTIDFYEKQPWSWISFDKTSVSLNPGETTTFLATVTIPPNGAMGSYEVGIYIEDIPNKHTVTIPTLVNVGANSPNFVFGGNLPVTDLHDVNRIYGGRDFTLLGSNVRYTYLGDWRFFYVFLPDDGINVAGASIKMVIQLNWTVKPSDIDMIAFTPAAAADTASQFAATRFGPKSLREATASEIEGKPKFKTLSNSSQDYISFQLMGGLNTIALHQMILNGDKPYETFQGSGMWWRVPREMREATQELTGDVPGSLMLSNYLFDGVRASAVGPAITSKNTSEIIQQDWQDWMRALPWGQALAKGSYSYCIQLKKVLILDVHLMGLPDVTDLDLGLFRDRNDDCKLDEATEAVGQFCVGKRCDGGGPQWAYDADGDADEQIIWTKPDDGYYIIKILGFEVPGGAGHFDLEVQQTLDTGTGYWVPEAPKPQEIILGTAPVLPSFNIVNFSMAWDFPGDQEDGNYSGAVQLGTSTAAGIIVVPAIVILDRITPRIVSFSVQSRDLLVNETDPTLTNDAQPTLVVSFDDPTMGTIARETIRMHLDGNDVTQLSRITLPLQTSTFALPGTTGPWGYWVGDISHTPINPLDSGIHILYIRIGDEAGNYISQNFTFTTDLLSPSLSLAGAAIEYTQSNTSLIEGTTDPFAYVQVAGQWYQTDSTGDFSVQVNLDSGNNQFDVLATRWFTNVQGVPTPANPAMIQKHIVNDQVAPTMVGRGVAPAGLYVNVATVTVFGQVSDEIAQNRPLDPSLLTLTVNGEIVPVLPDGSFNVIVPLQEGQNTIQITITDPAGNTATDSPLVINRDTILPTLQVVGLPEKVETEVITVTVQSESGLRMSINGFDATESAGVYSRDISLSAGSNLIIIKAEDRAKNVAELRVTVVYSAPSGLGSSLFGSAGGGGAIAFMILIVVVVVVIVFFAMRYLVPRKPKSEEEELPEEVETIEVPEEEIIPVEEEAATEETTVKEIEISEAIAEEEPMVERPLESQPPMEIPKEELSSLKKFRVMRAKAALEEGKISQSVYEQNIATLGLTLEEADQVVEQVRSKEEADKLESEVKGVNEKAARLKSAYESGRLSKEIYVQNLKALGLPVPPELEE